MKRGRNICALCLPSQGIQGEAKRGDRDALFVTVSPLRIRVHVNTSPRW